jgi:methylated-DNA-[protein]-cysteine S-methyltransferase
MPSPLGELTLAATEAGLRSVSWGVRGVNGRHRPVAFDGDPHGERERATAILRAAAEQLTAYFAGERTEFDIPLDPGGTPFQRRAWAVLRAIPFGTTISYADQARRLGDARKARAVGGANGKNPLPIVVPCHRVIGSSGALVGFAAGTGSKAWLLDHERCLAMGGRRRGDVRPGRRRRFPTPGSTASAPGASPSRRCR